MTYDVLDIAQYVINKAIDKEKPVSNLKLQKILFYIQVNFLTINNKPCFNEPIVRWRHGPVVEEVYAKYGRFIGKPITVWQKDRTYLTFDKSFNVVTVVKKFNYGDINKNHRILIDSVIDKLISIDGWDLVNMTNNEKSCINTTAKYEITQTMINKYHR